MKTKLKNFFQKIWSVLNDEKYEKVILIGAPIATVLLAALLLGPEIGRIIARPKETVEQPPQNTQMEAAFPAQDAGSGAGVPAAAQTAPPASPAAISPAPQTSPAPTAQVSPAPTAGPEQTARRTTLRAFSTENDLYVTVYGPDGSSVTGVSLTLTFTYPDGSQYSFQTDAEGDCYLVNLEAGEYGVSMSAQQGYAAPDPIRCTVLEKLAYEQIEDIEDVVDIVDVAQIPEEEVNAPEPESSGQILVVEELSSPEESGGAAQEYPVLDRNGNQTYTYTYDVGPNGNLLFRDTGEESQVMPVDEDGDGQLDFGMYYFIPQTPEEGTESGLTADGYYVSVELFNEDNTPVEEYAIYAEPIMSADPEESFEGWRELDGRMYYYDGSGAPVRGLKKIDGRFYFFDEYGVRASSLGVDVSYYNGDINWQAVKAQGIDFAIIRVGGRTWRDGQLYDDYRTAQYLANAKAAGIKVGAYFYSTAITEAEAVQEASVALNTLNGAALDFPVFIDMEQSGIYPEGRSDKLSAEERSNIIKAFCETVENSGYAAGVYSGEYFMKNNLDYGSFAQYKVWLASYTSDSRLPAFSNRYDIWQFTDSAQVDGISGGTDLNVIF